MMIPAADLFEPLRAVPHRHVVADHAALIDNECGCDFPSMYSVRGRILAALLHGERLTSRDAWCRWGASRLAASIHQLKCMGWEIQTVLVDVLTSDGGREARIARYFMTGDAIRKAGGEGRCFAAATQAIEAKKKAKQ